MAIAMPFALLSCLGGFLLWIGFLNSGTREIRGARYISAFSMEPDKNNGDFMGSERFYPRGWHLNGTIDKLCSHTTEVHIDDQAEHMQSFAWGRPKLFGGDEYYIIAGQEQDPDAVALVDDAGSGTYTLQWISMRSPGFSPHPLNTRVTVILQYSCGRGLIDKASRKWAKPENLFLRWEFNRSIASMSHLQETITPRSLQISDFRSLLGVGDSLLEQFMLGDSSARVEGAVMLKMQTNLLPETVNSHMKKIRELSNMSRPALLLLNGGVWNVLRLAKSDPMFKQYTVAVEKLLQTVEKEFPDVTIGWVGMTAMHIHRAKCLSSGKAWKCYQRISYLSSSRALTVAKIVQSVVAQHPRVYHIPMYNRTYVSAHCARPGDGRHYEEKCNAHWWSDIWGNSTHLMPAH